MLHFVNFHICMLLFTWLTLNKEMSARYIDIKFDKLHVLNLKNLYFFNKRFCSRFFFVWHTYKPSFVEKKFFRWFAKMSHCGKLKFFFPSNKLLLDGKFGKIHLTVRTAVNIKHGAFCKYYSNKKNNKKTNKRIFNGWKWKAPK